MIKTKARYKQAEWTKKSIQFANNKTINFLLLENDGMTADYILPSNPFMLLSDGKPDFSLDLVLKSQPQNEENSVYPDISRGLLHLNLRNSFGEDIKDKIQNSLPSREIKNLFIEQIEYQFYENTFANEKIITTAYGSLGAGDVKLFLPLDKAQSQSIIDLLDKKESSIFLRTKINYHIESKTKRLQFLANWLEIYNFILAKTDDQNNLSLEELELYISELITIGIIKINGHDSESTLNESQDVKETIVKLMSVVLTVENTLEHSKYKLKNPPSPFRQLNFTKRVSIKNTEKYVTESNLSVIFKDTLDTFVWDNHIRLYVDNPSTIKTVQDIKRNIKKENLREDKKNRPIDLAIKNNTVNPISTAILPSQNHQLVNTNLNSNFIKGQYINFGNFKLESNNKLKSLPIVKRINEPYWKDRIDSNKYWYAPDFKITIPELNDTYENSPFKFKITKIGVTDQGKPALKGEVEFEIQLIPSKKTTEALQKKGISNAKIVTIKDLVVKVSIPFRDKDSGELKYETLDTLIQKNGNSYICKAVILNNYAMLAYGALSTENFQSLNAEVKIKYNFDSYKEFKKGIFNLRHGGKTLQSPIELSNAKEISIGTSKEYNSKSKSYRNSGRQIKIPRVRTSKNKRPSLKPILAITKPVTYTKPVYTVPVKVPQILNTHPSIIEKIKSKKYYKEEQIIQTKHGFLFPCTDYGNVYVEHKNGQNQVIGCTDAFKLGEIPYRQFEEIPTLEKEHHYKVFRSLSQPDKFLVQPNLFIISRGFQNSVNPYKPQIFLSVVLDVDNQINNIIELHTNLEPNIPEWMRAELLENLKTFSNSPQLFYPTDTAESYVFEFVLSNTIEMNGIVDVSHTNAPFLKTSFRANLPNWLAIKSQLELNGINGNIVFSLSDGTILRSGFSINLNKIGGPWNGGPISITKVGNNAIVKNEIESTINLLAFSEFTQNNIGFDHPHVLEPFSEIIINQYSDDLLPIYSIPVQSQASVLDEHRVTIEDIFIEVLILNLSNLLENSINKLLIKVKLEGSDHIENIQISDQADQSFAKVEFILPLTEYLEKKKIEYQITKVYTDGTTEELDTKSIDLSQQLTIDIDNTILNIAE